MCTQFDARRFLLAALIGALTYHLAVVYAGGVFAAMGVSKSYFAFFGRAHLGLALAVLNLGTWALPVGAIVFVACCLTLRAFRGAGRHLGLAFFLGMFGAFLFWHISFVLSTAADAAPATVSAMASFFETLRAPWWSLPNVVAPWLGFALAVRHMRNKVSRTRADALSLPAGHS